MGSRKSLESYDSIEVSFHQYLSSQLLFISHWQNASFSPSKTATFYLALELGYLAVLKLHAILSSWKIWCLEKEKVGGELRGHMGRCRLPGPWPIFLDYLFPMSNHKWNQLFLPTCFPYETFFPRTQIFTPIPNLKIHPNSIHNL